MPCWLARLSKLWHHAMNVITFFSRSRTFHLTVEVRSWERPQRGAEFEDGLDGVDSANAKPGGRIGSRSGVWSRGYEAFHRLGAFWLNQKKTLTL